MLFLNRLSIRHQLFLMILGVAVLGIVLSSMFLIVSDYHRFYRQTQEQYRVRMDLAADFLVPTLVFNDAAGAGEILGNLVDGTEMMNAAVVTKTGHLFAVRFEDRLPDFFHEFDGKEAFRKNDRLYLQRPVNYRGESLGILYTVTSLENMQGKIRHHIFYTSLVLLGILILFFFLARYLQGTISRPIQDLADSMRRISSEPDYSLRLSLKRNDEIGTLYNEFNQLLKRLEYRKTQFLRAQQSLRQLNEQLEERVQSRTEELKRANEELESFSYSVSHDLQAPLRHMDSFLKLYERSLDTPPSDAQSHYLESIRTAISVMIGLIEGLLTLSRMSRAELRIQRLDMNEMVDEVIQGMGPEIGDRTIEWRVQRLLPVKGDPVLIRQVLENLIGNALKFTRGREQAVIDVSGEKIDKSMYCVKIRDNGVGFNPKYQDKLFKVFQRLHHEDEYEGTGIGLANVKRIVTRHGGEVNAENNQSEGACFSFSLPLDRGEK